MSQPQSNHTQEISAFEILLNFVHILVKKKRIIFLFTLSITFITVVTVLIVDSRYKSIGLVKPPKKGDNSVLQEVLKESGAGMGGLLGSFMGNNDAGLDDCMSILNSARFSKIVVEKFDLETVFEFKKKNKKKKKYYFADVIKEFEKRRGFNVTEEGAIEISMEDKSPKQANEIVNFMITLLDSLYTDVQKAETKQKLEYLDNRMILAEADIKHVEDSLIAFENKYNFFIPEVQVQMVLEGAARTELEIEEVKEELALEAALRGKNGARYRDLSIKLGLLKKAMFAKINSHVDSNQIVLPARALSALATEYFRLDRAYKVKLGVFKYLSQQIESLKLEVAKNTAAISVLDPSWVNDKRISPKRRVIVEAAFILSFIFSSLMSVLLTIWEKHRDLKSPSYELALKIRHQLFKI